MNMAARTHRPETRRLTLAEGVHRQWCCDAPRDPEVADLRDEIVVAMRLRGKTSGPTLLICGREAVCRPIFGQIMRLPSLPWLSGTLLLGYLGEFEAAEPVPPAATEAERDPIFDDALFLEFAGEKGPQEIYRRQAYWTILRKMAAIGMISGRGVPAS